MGRPLSHEREVTGTGRRVLGRGSFTGGSGGNRNSSGRGGGGSPFSILIVIIIAIIFLFLKGIIWIEINW